MKKLAIISLVVLSNLAVFGAEDSSNLPPESSISIAQKDLETVVTDFQKHLSQTSELVANGRSQTSKDIDKFTTETLNVVSQILDLQEKCNTSLTNSTFPIPNFSPYSKVIDSLHHTNKEATDLHKKLLENASAPEKINALTLIVLLVQTLSEKLYVADDHYNTILIETLVSRPLTQRSRLHLDDDIYYTEYREKWRSDKTPESKSLAISKLLAGAKDFDDFMTRFVFEPFDGFMPLLGLTESGAPQDFLRQGWKIHVSAKPENSHKIAEIVLPILAKLNVAHKILGSMKKLRDLQLDSIQKGKFITIYPLSNQQAFLIASTLDKALTQADFKPENFDAPSHDALIGDTGGIFTRYGAYSGMNLVIVDQQGNPQIDEAGKYVTTEDVRDADYKPYFITWEPPFASLLKTQSSQTPLSPKSPLKRTKAKKLEIAQPSEETIKDSLQKHVRGETIEEKERQRAIIATQQFLQKKYSKQIIAK